VYKCINPYIYLYIHHIHNSLAIHIFIRACISIHNLATIYIGVSKHYAYILCIYMSPYMYLVYFWPFSTIYIALCTYYVYNNLCVHVLIRTYICIHNLSTRYTVLRTCYIHITNHMQIAQTDFRNPQLPAYIHIQNITFKALYGVATISRLLKITRLFCKRAF